MRTAILQRSTVAQYKGIRLADVNGNESDNEAFVACTLDALKLIEERDPRRFRRIQKEVRYISNAIMLSRGQYSRVYRECKVRFPDYQKISQGALTLEGRDNEDYLWYLAFYAATLIHEATHGHLDSLGFPYTPEYRVRLERICHTEEERFVAHLSSDDYDLRPLIPTFDETAWHTSWNRSAWQHRQMMFRLLKDGIRRIWQDSGSG